MTHSTQDTRWECQTCGHWIGPAGERLKPSEGQGGKHMRYAYCRECGERVGLGVKREKP